MNFQLGARTLGIDATEDAFPAALEAIRKAGFAPEPIVSPATVEGQAREGHGELHDHDHELGGGIARLALALALPVAAEAAECFAPEGLSWKMVGMGLSLAAIWFAGLDVYKKGMAALLRGKLNINALMSVAVTGAFLIGQWPEAAMVMALYAIAELIEARAVDRARNAIKGLLALAPDEALMQTAEGQWKLTPVAQVPLEATVVPVPARHLVLGTPLQGPWSGGMQRATFAMGCFWGAEKFMWKVPRVCSTFVGYQGGFTPNPTYEEVCTQRTGHAEVAVVIFDPARVDYDTLLKVFWENHDPTQWMRQGGDIGTQYRSAIMVEDDEQKARATESRDRYQAALTAAGFGQIVTLVVPSGRFYYPRTTTSSTCIAIHTAIATTGSARPPTRLPTQASRQVDR